MERRSQAPLIFLGVLVLGACVTVAYLYTNREHVTAWLSPYLQSKTPTESPRVAVVREPTPTQIEALVAQFKAACEANTLQQADALHYWKGHHEEERRADLQQFDASRKNIVIDKVRYLTMNEAKQELPARLLQGTTKSFSFNGLVQTPNLSPVGFLNGPNFLPRARLPEGGYYFPVGLTPSGELKIIAYVKTGTPIVTPEPALKFTPQIRQVPKALSDMFTQELKEAFAQRDELRFLRLFELRGSTQDEINQNAEIFARLQQLDDLQIKDIEFYSFPTGGVVSIEGRTFNLPIVGHANLILQSASKTKNFPNQLIVGMNEKGELKIPLMQKTK